jgi:hypothetical protein
MEQKEPSNDNLDMTDDDFAPPTPKQLSTKDSFTPPYPKIAVSPELLARRAAAARAYALSSTPSSSTGAYNPPRANTPTRGKSPNEPKTLIANRQPQLTGMTWHLKNRLKELEGVGEEDYANFMRSLLVDDLEDGIISEFGMDTEDDEDYNIEADDLEPLDDYDDEDDKSQDTDAHKNGVTTSQDTKDMAGENNLEPTIDYYGTDNFFLDPIALEEELGGLLEEDMEAAVNSLLQQDDNDGGTEPGQIFQRSPPYSSPQSDSKSSTTPIDTHTSNIASTVIRFPSPTDRQILHLQKLMNQHYQILIEQSTLAVRAAHGNKFKDNARGTSKRKRTELFFCSGENPDELAGILDGAVTMLQDLDKNRKDAIRYSIQMRRVRSRMTSNDSAAANTAVVNVNTHALYPSTAPSAARAILGGTNDEMLNEEQGILTRSVFSRTLRESDWKSEPINPTHGFGTPGAGQLEQHVVVETSNSNLGASTTFGVRGLARLNETFTAIDNSIKAYSDQGVGVDRSNVQIIPAANGLDSENIFSDQDHGRACEMLLRYARADYDRNLIPGYRDMTDLLTYPSEVIGENTGMAMTQEQQRLLRHSRLQFTAAEDNLLLRGVVSIKCMNFNVNAIQFIHTIKSI